ncbi:hypothetical protein [Microbacterium sp. JZ31]|uniref:hypothetical protein n=1 Tax=Microbacterium sp. JZ31 TaxID=1906274 RepID=UPI0019317DCD|nr:hypothetical protein [Microbacterium sp. JZ31]
MKKHTKVLASLVVAGALSLGAPLAAQAYPAPTPTTGPADSSVTGSFVAGGTVVVSFSGFAPDEEVSISLTGAFALSATIASAADVETQTVTRTADADGNVAVSITLPANAYGVYTVTATGLDSGVAITETFDLGGGAAGGGGGLAATGAGDLTGLWVGGGALVLTGGAIVVATAVRRSRQNEV